MNVKTEFLAELLAISCLRHKNLVQLQGWCVEKGELLLVYDYMPNGSINKVLYVDYKHDTNPLTWPQRYNVAVGLALVLTCTKSVSSKSSIEIITSNVMLDVNFNSRLEDFGWLIWWIGFWGLHSEGSLVEAADPSMKMEFDEKQKKVLLVGLSCANPDCLGRPNSRRVLHMLNNEATPVLVPKSKPTLSFSTSFLVSIEDIVS